MWYINSTGNYLETKRERWTFGHLENNGTVQYKVVEFYTLSYHISISIDDDDDVDEVPLIVVV